MLENREERWKEKPGWSYFPGCLSAFMLRVLNGFISSKRSKEGVKDKRKKISLTLKD